MSTKEKKAVETKKSSGDKAVEIYPYKKGQFKYIDTYDVKILDYINTNIIYEKEVVPPTTKDNAPSLNAIKELLGLKSIKSLHKRLDTLTKYDYITKDVQGKITYLGIRPNGKKVLKSSGDKSIGLSKQWRQRELFTEAQTPYDLIPEKDRPHKTKIALLFPEISKPKWNQRTRNSIVSKLKKKFGHAIDNSHKLKNNNGSIDFQIKTEQETRDCHIFRHKIVVDVFYPKSLKQFDNSQDFYKYLKILESQAIKVLEDKLGSIGLSLQKNGKYRSEMITNEIGRPYDKIATLVNALRDKGAPISRMIQSTIDGAFILEFDRSFLGIDEVDFKQTKGDVKRPEKTGRNWDEFLALGADGKVANTVEVVEKMVPIIEKTVKTQNQLSNNQLNFSNDMVDYGQKIATHTQSIQKLGEGVEKFSGKIDELITIVNKQSQGNNLWKKIKKIFKGN